MCALLFQYLCKHRRLPEFERFLAIEPVEKIVAPVHRDREMLPKWFSIYEELSSSQHLPPMFRNTRLGKLTPASTGLIAASNVPFDPNSRQNVRVLLNNSADVARAATSSIIPADMLSSTITASISHVTGSVVNSQPSSSAALQGSFTLGTYRPEATSTSVSLPRGDVLILTADQLQQLGLDASMLPVVASSQVTTSATFSQIPDIGSAPFLESPPPSVSNDQSDMCPATTTSQNLIGQAFASAVGISIEQLGSYGDAELDTGHWDSPPQANVGQPTTMSVSPLGDDRSLGHHELRPSVGPENNSTNVTTIHTSDQTSILSTNLLSVHSIGSPSHESSDIFARCDTEVDVSALDITMLNGALSPALPYQPCDPHINNDSTLATPKKMERTGDDAIEVRIPVATAVLHSVTEVSDGQHTISGVGISGGFITSVSTTAFGSGGVMSTMSSDLCPAHSPTLQPPLHGLTLVSSMPHKVPSVPGANDIRGPSAVVSVAISTSLLGGVPPVTAPSERPITTQHSRSQLKRGLSTQRPILPRTGQATSPTKFFSSDLPKSRKQKSPVKVNSRLLQRIAPKSVVTRSFLSPVKQVAASITARARRLQSSPSRGVWSAAQKLTPNCLGN